MQKLKHRGQNYRVDTFGVEISADLREIVDKDTSNSPTFIFYECFDQTQDIAFVIMDVFRIGDLNNTRRDQSSNIIDVILAKLLNTVQYFIAVVERDHFGQFMEMDCCEFPQKNVRMVNDLKIFLDQFVLVFFGNQQINMAH